MSSKLTIFTDGGSRNNPGKAAAAAVISDAAGNLREICGKYLGIATNNVAEYTGVIIAFENLLANPNVETASVTLEFFTDSNLLANQLSGKFKIKNPELQKLATKVKEYEKRFAKVTYQHVPREQNSAADREVNKILDQN